MKKLFSALGLLAIFSTAPASANFMKKFTDAIPNPETIIDQSFGEQKPYGEKVKNNENIINDSSVNNKTDSFENFQNPADNTKFNLSDLNPSGANGTCTYKGIDMANEFYKNFIDSYEEFTFPLINCLAACNSYNCIKQKQTWREVYLKETGSQHYSECGTGSCQRIRSQLGYDRRNMSSLVSVNDDGTCYFLSIGTVKCPGHDKKYPDMINNNYRGGYCLMTKTEQQEYSPGFSIEVIAGPFDCPSDYMKG